MGNTKGDSTSTAAQELMLWLEWEGGQLPIGWDKGPAATIDSLFGTSWKLYEDVNHSNGMTVVSLLSPQPSLRQFLNRFETSGRGIRKGDTACNSMLHEAEKMLIRDR